jgi:drug/metabolite transporter (DMT)-like permease
MGLTKMATFSIALLSIFISVLAQFALKRGMSSEVTKTMISESLDAKSLFTVLTNKYIAFGFILYAAGAVIWLKVLSSWDVSKAYPLVGIGFAITVTIGFFLGEHISLSRIIGTALIGLGVYLISTS